MIDKGCVEKYYKTNIFNGKMNFIPMRMRLISTD